jgi:Domain of unknown function (DUF4412)
MKTFLLSTAFLFTSIYSFAGYYIEFKVTSAQGMSGTMKSWYQDGSTRSQMNFGEGMPAMGPGMGMMNMTSLQLKSNPDAFYILNEKEKTYFESGKRKHEGETNDDKEKYEVAVLGKETVNGYSTTHVTLKAKTERTGIMHWWVTTDVKGYSDLADMKNRYINGSAATRAMAEKGVQGFPVRMKMGVDKMEMQMDLVKAELMDIPDSKFSLEGYTKQDRPSPMMPGGVDMQKIQNMTPEERQKFVEQMQKQYGRKQE